MKNLRLHCSMPTLGIAFLGALVTFGAFGLGLGLSREAQAEPNRSAVVAAYDVTETISEDQCYPDRDVFQNKYRWYLVRTAAGNLLLWNPDANFLNPLEHMEIPLDAKLTATVAMKAERFKGNHSSELTFGRIGYLASDLEISGDLNAENIQGTFSYTVRFTEGGELGRKPLELWIQSYNALKKINAKFDSIPTISAKPPCRINGSLSGVARSTPENFLYEKERDYILALRKSEELFAAGEVESSTKPLETAAALAPERTAAYWRLSRAYFVMAEHLPMEDRAGRMKLLTKANEYGLKGVNADPASGESWFFLTVARGRFATTKGLIKMIRETGQLEVGFLKAQAAKPKYNFSGFITAGDIHCGLGIYYRLVPDWWVVKALTGSRGDLDKSVNHLRQALRFQPYRVEYLKELGVSLVCRGMKRKNQKDIDEGLDIFRNTLEMTNLLQTDPLDKTHMQDLLKNHEKVCAYSRDGYQDLEQPIETEGAPKPQEHPGK